MSVPTQDQIEQSLARLPQGLPLLKKDFFNIAWAYTFHPDQNRLLLEIGQTDPKLAETLIVFRKTLLESADSPAALEAVIDQLTIHFWVNTNGPIPVGEGDDPFDVFEAATLYGASLCVEVAKGTNDVTLLRIHDKEIMCPAWGSIAGWSDAWALRQVGPVINRARYGRDDVIPSHVFGFDENAEDHSLQNAMTLADFSHLAYFEPGFIEKQVRKWGYDKFQWVEDERTDTQALVAGQDRHLVVCFRGTSSRTDALTDATFLKTDAFGGVGQVHKGFQNALDSVWEKVRAAVDELGKDKKLFFSGHSLGAALAQLAAHRFAMGRYPVAGVYVFGSPRAGNKAFRDAYNKLLETRTFLHINHSDVVTQIPPLLLGFHHLGAPARVFDQAHLISMLQEGNVAEVAYEDLDEEKKAEIREQLAAAQTALDASTAFLRTPPHRLKASSYATTFETGSFDDHGIDQYLFKFGCAIVDGQWKRVGT